MRNQTSSLANQMKHRDRDMVPAFLVKSMFGLMLASVAIVAYAQIMDVPNSGVVADSPVVAERVVTLNGTRDAGVAVLDASGVEIAHSTKNKGGFIDVIWVSVSRERTVNGKALDAPLRIVKKENGRVAIIDDTTDFEIELIGYGKDNIAAFARLVDAT